MVAKESRSVRWVGEPCEPGCSYGAQSLPHFGAQVIQTSIGAIDGLLLLVQL